MLLVDAPQLAPGACITCLTSQGPFIDTQVDRDGWGRVYLCARCATDVGVSTGLASGAELRDRAALAESNAQLRDERDGALAEILRIRDAVRTTLEQGGIKVRKGEFRLRAPRGKARVDV